MNALHNATIRETRHRARETKFVADVALYPKLVEWARQRLGPDGHGAGPYADEYATSTLYFETDGFDVYRRTGSYGRSKYRIRRYGAAEAVFLERKFRTERLLAKRRTIVPLSMVARLSTDRPAEDWPGYWFHRRLQLRRLRPLVQLSYDRVARVGQSASGPIRLTIDRNLRGLPLPDFAFMPPIGQPFLEQRCIVEVKYQMTLPVLFREMAETFCLDVEKISKFRSALRSLDYPLEREDEEEVPQPFMPIESDPAGTYAD